jgi:acetyl-CoA synthetase
MSGDPFEQFDLSGVSSYEEAEKRISWELPDTFNMGSALVDRHADQRDRVAVFWENVDGPNESWTFWELHQQCNRFGNALHNIATDEEMVVGVFMPQRPETIVAHAGTWRAGGTSVPLPYTYESESLVYRIEDAGISVLVGHADKRETLRNVVEQTDTLEHVLLVGELPDDRDAHERHYDEAVESSSTDFTPVETAPDDTGIIIYTSGTTGEPKGGVHGHRILLGHLPGYQMIYNMDMEGVYYTPAGWGWGGGLLDLVSPALMFGQPVVAMNDDKFRPDEHFALMEQYGITHSFMPPTALNMLRDEDDSEYELQLEVLATGGEALTSDAYEWAENRDVVINEFYGQTEANFIVANCNELWGTKPGSMGRAMPGRDVAVVDDEAEPVETGEVGEVALKHPENDPIYFKRFLHKPEKTNAVRTGDWHLTGDLASMDEDGYFWYKSRKDDVIISSGYRISPTVVENDLMQHAAVAEAAVVGIPDETRGELVKAFVKLAEGYEPSDALVTELQEFVKDNLAKHEYPRAVEFVDEFPTTESGKIRRKELREQEQKDG